jgi:hypothetical protein
LKCFWNVIVARSNWSKTQPMFWEYSNLPIPCRAQVGTSLAADARMQRTPPLPHRPAAVPSRHCRSCRCCKGCSSPCVVQRCRFSVWSAACRRDAFIIHLQGHSCYALLHLICIFFIAWPYECVFTTSNWISQMLLNSMWPTRLATPEFVQNHSFKSIVHFFGMFQRTFTLF